jgi:hypothetical protein
MKQSLLTYITKIATPTKVVVTALVAVISAVSTLAMVIYNKGKADAKKEVKEISYEGKIDKLILSDSLKTITLQELMINQNEIIFKQEEQKNAYNSLRTVVLDIAKNQKVTLDQMQQYMESTPVLKKKLMTIR